MNRPVYLDCDNIVGDIEFILDETNNRIQRIDTICELFSWAESPQGYDFWSEEEDNLYAGKDISHEARMYLTVLLEYENANMVSDRTIG